MTSFLSSLFFLCALCFSAFAVAAPTNSEVDPNQKILTIQSIKKIEDAPGWQVVVMPSGMGQTGSLVSRDTVQSNGFVSWQISSEVPFYTDSLGQEELIKNIFPAKELRHLWVPRLDCTGQDWVWDLKKDSDLQWKIRRAPFPAEGFAPDGSSVFCVRPRAGQPVILQDRNGRFVFQMLGQFLGADSYLNYFLKKKYVLDGSPSHSFVFSNINNGVVVCVNPDNHTMRYSAPLFMNVLDDLMQGKENALIQEIMPNLPQEFGKAEKKLMVQRIQVLDGEDIRAKITLVPQSECFSGEKIGVDRIQKNTDLGTSTAHPNFVHCFMHDNEQPVTFPVLDGKEWHLDPLRFIVGTWCQSDEGSWDVHLPKKGDAVTLLDDDGVLSAALLFGRRSENEKKFWAGWAEKEIVPSLQKQAAQVLLKKYPTHIFTQTKENSAVQNFLLRMEETGISDDQTTSMLKNWADLGVLDANKLFKTQVHHFYHSGEKDNQRVRFNPYGCQFGFAPDFQLDLPESWDDPTQPLQVKIPVPEESSFGQSADIIFPQGPEKPVLDAEPEIIKGVAGLSLQNASEQGEKTLQF